jgi:hypothetical protein
LTKFFFDPLFLCTVIVVISIIAFLCAGSRTQQTRLFHKSAREMHQMVRSAVCPQLYALNCMPSTVCPQLFALLN